MVRSTLLKYSLQCRLGNMDGCLVSYHNTKETFGFEYLPLNRMDRCLYGSTWVGNLVVESSLKLMERLLKDILQQVELSMPKMCANAKHGVLVTLSYEERHHYLNIFVETIPSHGWASMEKGGRTYGALMVDAMSTKQLKATLKQHGASTEGNRIDLVCRLEGVLASGLTQLPSAKFYQRLAKSGFLSLFRVDINMSQDNKKVKSLAELKWIEGLEKKKRRAELSKMKVNYLLTQKPISESDKIGILYRNIIMTTDIVGDGSQSAREYAQAVPLNGRFVRATHRYQDMQQAC